MLRNFLLLPFYFVLGAESFAERVRLSISCGGSWAYDRKSGSDLLSYVTTTEVGGADFGE